MDQTAGVFHCTCMCLYIVMWSHVHLTSPSRDPARVNCVTVLSVLCSEMSYDVPLALQAPSLLSGFSFSLPTLLDVPEGYLSPAAIRVVRADHITVVDFIRRWSCRPNRTNAGHRRQKMEPKRVDIHRNKWAEMREKKLVIWDKE